MLRGEPATSRDLVRDSRASATRFGDTRVSPEPLGRGWGGYGDAGGDGDHGDVLGRWPVTGGWTIITLALL